MTDDEILRDLRQRFATEFSVVGPDAFRCILVDPDKAAVFMLQWVRELDEKSDESS